MHQVTADALDQEGAEDIRDDYSGRGMMGKTTHAVIFKDWSEALKAVTQVAYDTGKGEHDDEIVILADLKKLRYDSMGRSIVIY